MIYIILGVIGLICGSFINALVWRMHENGNRVSNKKYSILFGRSVCPNCKHKLSAFDLIPVISWVYLKRSCRYCHKPISVQYPIVELVTSLFFLLSYMYWPLSLNTEGVFSLVIWLAVVVGIIALAIYDLRWLLLPNKILFPLIFIVFVSLIIRSVIWPGGRQLLEGGLWGVFIIFGLFYLIYWSSKGRWIGGGDVKLAILIGMLVGGPMNAIFTIFLASVVGTLVSLPLMILGKLKSKSVIPFGPFLILATMIAYLFGSLIIQWYKRLLII